MYATGDVHVSIRPRSNVTAGGVFAESASLQFIAKYGRVWHVVWCRLELVGGNQICKILANASNFGNIPDPATFRQHYVEIQHSFVNIWRYNCPKIPSNFEMIVEI